MHGPSAASGTKTAPSSERIIAITASLSILSYGFGEERISETGHDFLARGWPLVRDWSVWLINCTNIIPSSTTLEQVNLLSYPDVVETIERAVAAAMAHHGLVIAARFQHDADTITALNALISLWCYCSADQNAHSPHKLVRILGYWLAPRTSYPTINGRISLSVIDEMVATIRLLPYDSFARAMSVTYDHIEQNDFKDVEHITGFLSLLNMITLGNIVTLASRGFYRWHTTILKKLTSRRLIFAPKLLHLEGVVRACVGNVGEHLKSRGSSYVTQALRAGVVLGLIQAGVLMSTLR